jgi:hypothetical protein
MITAKGTAHFSQQLNARANGRVRLVDSILDDRDWRGKAWYLERTAPAEFGRVDVRELPAPETPEREKHIDVAFILNMPDGTQRQTSFQEAQKMFANFPVKTLEAQKEPDTEPEPGSSWDGDVGKLGKACQEPNGDQPLS